MAKYLTGTLTKFSRNDVDGYSVPDYMSINYTEIRQYMADLPTYMYDWEQISDGDKWERISLEIYGNQDYWDILLLLNDRHSLLGLPLSFQTLSELADNRVARYEQITGELPNIERERLYDSYENDAVALNENNRIIKVVNPSRMNEFLQGGYDLGLFK